MRKFILKNRPGNKICKVVDIDDETNEIIRECDFSHFISSATIRNIGPFENTVVKFEIPVTVIDTDFNNHCNTLDFRG